MNRSTWELLSYIVTAFGFPLAIFIFFYEQHQERLNEEDEVYQLLSDNYQDFLHTVLENSDLHLTTKESTKNLNEEQKERMYVIFSMLIALFERAYLLLYNPPLTKMQKRRWGSWDDYIEEWLMRDDFRNLLPLLLKGEDPKFVKYMNECAQRNNQNTTLE
jgi:hypothetical protein